MAPRPAHNSQTRRRRRRAAGRRSATLVPNLRPDDILEIQALVAAAFESTILTLSDQDDASAAEIAEMATQALFELGGKPSQGTKPDKRLKDNKDGMEAEMPEQAVLAALDAYQAAVSCSCGHAFSEHSGAGGSCGHADGRGNCSCGEFAYPEVDPDARELATAYVKIRPDLEGFEAEVETIVRAAIRRALLSAAGDVAWGLEEGFVDLLCDVNEQLFARSGGYGFDYDDEPGGYYCGPRAVDASVHLDKVLICNGDDYYVAPITIDASGEPVLSDRSEWVEVENGWIESQGDDDEMSAAMQLRFALRDVRIVLTADGATAPPIPVEHQPDERLPEPSGEPIPAPASSSTAGSLKWTATFVPEGILTEDGRAFAPGALILPPDEQARQLPLTLMAMIETSAEGGHDGAKIAGRIDQMWREGNLVKASGVFDDGAYGQDIARMVGDGTLRGLSVDIAPLEWERSPASDWFDGEGNWIAQQGDDGEWIPAGEAPSLEDAIDRLFGGGEDMVLVITKGVIGMATVCPFPAFGQASISLAASGAGEAPIVRYAGQAGFIVTHDHPALVAGAAAVGAESVAATVEEADEENEGLTAAAAGLAFERPPAEWFDDPELDGLTALTITEDGRVYGHAWEWETCHLSFDTCVVAPHSLTDYAYFQLGEVECESGERISIGKITLDTGHAGQRLTRAEATRHYDDTGTVAAYVAFGEDEFGGWFAGAIAPELSESKLRVMRGATISGDWRGVNGNLELIALLAVNVPGFPVPRQRELVASGEFADGRPDILALTAAGILTKERLTAEQTNEIRELASGA